MELDAWSQMILDEIRENQRRLDGCKRHHFPTIPQVERIPTAFGLKLSCSKCGGSIDALQAYAYTRGFAAAGGNPNEIIPGWR